MQSHWEKLENIRVVDAGYLLAGMEPERKWQYALPLVANFFNLIREKTGAVKLATLPGERMEITQAEFQALKAEFGVTPATEPASAPEKDPTTLRTTITKSGMYVLPKTSPRDSRSWEILPEHFEVIEGVFMYEQAAREIADAQNGNDGMLQGLLERMRNAIHSGVLPTRERRTGLKCLPNNQEPLLLVNVADVNAWLEKDGVEYRWTLLKAVQSPAMPALVVQPTETISQRRHRYLDWHIEAQRSEKRGALQRVYERERMTNPRADRSAIGRDINQAKKEKTAAKNGGAMFSQLGARGSAR